MRILMITDVYFPRVNGVSTSIKTFIRELRQLDVEVVLIAPGYPGQDQESDEFEIIRIPSRKVMFDPEDRMMRSAHIKSLLPAIKHRHFDLVHIQTPFVAHYAGLWLARKLGLPVVESYHTFFEEYLYNYIRFLPRSLLKFVARSFSRSQCNNVNAVIVPSVAMKEVLRSYGIKTHIQIIPTGIDPGVFGQGDGAYFRRKQGIPDTRPMLVFVGRVAYEKNIAFLIEVLDEVRKHERDVLMVIAGEGPARKALKQMVDGMGLADNVLFIGYLPRNGELQNCYSAADVFVFASRTETQGLVLLESMALGTPVVSTAYMGTRDILHAQQGALVAAFEIKDFAHKVIELIRKPDFRNMIGREGRQLAGQWTAAKFARDLRHFYQEQVDESSVYQP